MAIKFKLSYIPNAICIFRIILVLPIVIYLINEKYIDSLILIALAGISDFLDGFLARKNNWRSELGATLDPIADKFLLITLFISLYIMQLIPYWLTAVVIMRDVMIAFGLFLYNYFVEKPKSRPTFISKLNTFLQIFFLLFVIASQIIMQPFQILALILGAIVFATSVLSCLDYWITWSIKAKNILTESG